MCYFKNLFFAVVLFLLITSPVMAVSKANWQDICSNKGGNICTDKNIKQLSVDFNNIVTSFSGIYNHNKIVVYPVKYVTNTDKEIIVIIQYNKDNTIGIVETYSNTEYENILNNNYSFSYKEPKKFKTLTHDSFIFDANLYALRVMRFKHGDIQLNSSMPPYIKKYVRNLKKQIRKKWYPTNAGNTILSLKIAKNGKLLNLITYYSLGNDEKYVNAALEAVKFSQPFNPLPNEYSYDYIDIQLEFPGDFGNISYGVDIPEISKDTNSNSNQPQYIKDYMSYVQNEIKYNWKPSIAPGSNEVVVLFTIRYDGIITNTKIIKSSGALSADEAAINAIKTIRRFKPLPFPYKNNSVDMQFTFDYNVYR